MVAHRSRPNSFNKQCNWLLSELISQSVSERDASCVYVYMYVSHLNKTFYVNLRQVTFKCINFNILKLTNFCSFIS